MPHVICHRCYFLRLWQIYQHWNISVNYTLSDIITQKKTNYTPYGIILNIYVNLTPEKI